VFELTPAVALAAVKFATGNFDQPLDRLVDASVQASIISF
jgi:hypothetical protein